jgi:hypothetical protein
MTTNVTESYASTAGGSTARGALSLALFEAAMFVVLIVSGVFLNRRRQALAAAQQQRYQRLAQFTSAPPGGLGDSPRAVTPRNS